MTACQGGEKQIASSSTDIVDLAHKSKARFEIIYREANAPDINTAVISSEALGGEAEQKQIIAAVNTIIHALPQVQDVASEWLGVLKWLSILAGIVGASVLIWQTGAGVIIKRGILWVTRSKGSA
jgi:hypothetical protein